MSQSLRIRIHGGREKTARRAGCAREDVPLIKMSGRLSSHPSCEPVGAFEVSHMTYDRLISESRLLCSATDTLRAPTLPLVNVGQKKLPAH